MFTSLTLCLDLFALLVAWTFGKAYLDAFNYCYFPFNDGKLKLTINGVITTHVRIVITVYLYSISLPKKKAMRDILTK